ncbi:MAG: hypothetical protein WCB68_05775 [Pyrinomonadaceae bacterium]
MRAQKRQRQLTVAAVIIVIVILAASVCAAGYGVQGQLKADDGRSKLVGNWTGESICAGNRPACHDEKVVYRVAKTADKPDMVTITADKIVDGKPETMAVLDFQYDGEKGTLVNEFTRRTTHGRWEFTVKGNVMEGVLLILPGKEIGRRVKVRKDE